MKKKRILDRFIHLCLLGNTADTWRRKTVSDVCRIPRPLRRRDSNKKRATDEIRVEFAIPLFDAPSIFDRWHCERRSSESTSSQRL